MDNKRLFIFIALCFVGLMLFQQWQYEQKQKSNQQGATGPAATAPAAKTPATPGVPGAPAAPAVKGAPAAPAAPGAPVVSGSGNKLPSAGKVSVETDVIRVEIDLLGGDIRTVDLLNYKTAMDDKTPFRLMTDSGAKLFVAQSALTGPAAMAARTPGLNAVYKSTVSSLKLADNEKEKQLVLTWVSSDGVKVEKIYTFSRDSYVITVEHRITNNSTTAWKGSVLQKLHRTQFGEKQGSSFIYTYMGGIYFTEEEHFNKYSFSDMQDYPLQKNMEKSVVTGGWVGMMQHYFVAAWVPEKKAVNQFYSYYDRSVYRYDIGMVSAEQQAAPGKTVSFKNKLFAGPKIQSRMEALTDGLDRSVDYGFLTIIAKPLFWLLDLFYSWIGNWGFAIILLTILIKLAFYKLSEASYRSMAKMRKVQPRMQALKERYGDDRQKMNQALMDLYKTEKINPLGGCLPILVQIPVFIALYWVLLESVEMRHAPFMLWIQDLSSQDPYFILPIIMGASMVIQQKLNPAPLDPLQKKIMTALPILFTIFFLFFPAGLVLYWVVNNVLSIAQQWVITKRIESGEEK